MSKILMGCELAGGRACVFHLIFTSLLAFEGKYI